MQTQKDFKDTTGKALRESNTKLGGKGSQSRTKLKRFNSKVKKGLRSIEEQDAYHVDDDCICSSDDGVIQQPARKRKRRDVLDKLDENDDVDILKDICVSGRASRSKRVQQLEDEEVCTPPEMAHRSQFSKDQYKLEQLQQLVRSQQIAE